MCDVLDRVENKGIEEGVDTAFSLIDYLLDHNRMDDLKRVTKDTAYRNKLMKEIFPHQA